MAVRQNVVAMEGSTSSAASRCSRCDGELPPSARFCPQCGAPVTDAAPATEAAHASPSGERRQVAILFADLCGYTRLSSTLDPEETHRLLTRYFEVADAILARLGGTIDKHIGDAVMAVFGAPVAFGNDIERALRAAVQIHAAMATISYEFRMPLGTHIGIASGEVVAAATGSAAHRNYTVTGDAVNLAARLTDLARQGETVISDDVQRSTADLADTQPLGSVAIRGLDADVRAWKLFALHASARLDHPLLGRETERRRFAELVERARRDGRGAVALLRADPGMGKSRLAEALLADARHTGVECHCATVLDFGEGQGRDAAHALACSLLGVALDATVDERRRALDADAAAWADDEPYLADLLLVPQRTASLYEAMDNAARKTGKLQALVHLVERASPNGCVLLVEDVHWASEWVVDCLRAISVALARLPVVLAMTTRRDGDPVTDRWAPDAIISFDLAPLDRGDALALARAYFAASPDIAERCVERAQGNPLFLVQLLESDTAGTAVPATIQSVVLARLDRLAPRDKTALQAAAVIGQRFPVDLLRHLVGDAHYRPVTPIERDLVRVDAGGGFMTFTHALIRDGAYASLLHAARRELHRAAADWYATRDPTLRAEHLDRADDPRAAEAYLDAARAEIAAMRSEAAVALLSQGARLPASPATRFALAALEGEVHVDLGAADRALAAFERALEAASNDAERCAAWIGVARAHRLTSAVAAGLAAVDAAEPLAVRSGAVRELAHLAYMRGSLHFSRGDIDACSANHARALDLARRAGDARCEAQALSGLADALYAQGRLRSARDAFTRCLAICEREGFIRFSIMNQCMVAIIGAHFGEFDAALAQLARTRGVAGDLQYRLGEAMCDESASFMLVFGGRYAEAAQTLARALSLAHAIGARRFEAIVEASSALVAWHDGRHDDARRHVRAAWALSEEIGPQFAGPIVLAAMAKCAHTPAERRNALRRGERLLAKRCLSHCYFGFYRVAIDLALEAGEWAEAERYAALLDDYTRPEPLPLIDLVVMRGRALAAAGRGDADRTALEACRARINAWKLGGLLPAVDAALAVTA